MSEYDTYLPNTENNLSTWPLEQMLGPNAPAKGMSKDKRLITMRLTKKHQTEFLERFEWKNLPPELNQDLIERILYYRFKGVFFKYIDHFWFQPFTLRAEDADGVDPYGRYDYVSPVVFTGAWDEKKGKFEDRPFLPEKASNVSIPVMYGKIKDKPEFPGIILTDTSLNISQDVTPEAWTIGPFIEQLTDILVLINIDLINSAKVYTIVAKDAAQKIAIEQEFQNLDQRILDGKRVIVVVSDIAKNELQELQGNKDSKDTSRYFQAYQSWDNLRKELIGLDNGGQFLKQEHMTDMENTKTGSEGNSILRNALRMRKEFAELVNYYYGTNISVEIAGQGDTQIVEEPGAQSKERDGDISYERGE